MTARTRCILVALIAALTFGGAGLALAEKIVVQVSDGNPVTWNQALNVVANLRDVYGTDTQIELVAFGQGINMLKLDAPVSSRVVEAQKNNGAKIYACETRWRRTSSHATTWRPM
jgi:intracellular sulfur oxidation DsrE/DsrF family protein